MFEITIDGLNMVENERRTTQSGNVRELRFVVSIGLSRTSENSSVCSTPLDFQIERVACICKNKDAVQQYLCSNI